MSHDLTILSNLPSATLSALYSAVDRVMCQRRDTRPIAHDPAKIGEGFAPFALLGCDEDAYSIASDSPVAHRWRAPAEARVSRVIPFFAEYRDLAMRRFVPGPPEHRIPIPLLPTARYRVALKVRREETK